MHISKLNRSKYLFVYLSPGHNKTIDKKLTLNNSPIFKTKKAKVLLGFEIDNELKKLPYLDLMKIHIKAQ